MTSRSYDRITRGKHRTPKTETLQTSVRTDTVDVTVRAHRSQTQLVRPAILRSIEKSEDSRRGKDVHRTSDPVLSPTQGHRSDPHLVSDSCVDGVFSPLRTRYRLCSLISVTDLRGLNVPTFRSDISPQCSSQNQVCTSSTREKSSGPNLHLPSPGKDLDVEPSVTGSQKNT